MEKEMATHSSILAWRIQWTEPSRLQSMGLLRVGHDWATSLSLFTFMHWRGKWQPIPVLQCSCLENPRDRGAWWTAVYGVEQSWTRLKRLSCSSSSSCWIYVTNSPIIPHSPTEWLMSNPSVKDAVWFLQTKQPNNYSWPPPNLPTSSLSQPSGLAKGGHVHPNWTQPGPPTFGWWSLVSVQIPHPHFNTFWEVPNDADHLQTQEKSLLLLHKAINVHKPCLKKNKEANSQDI